MGVFKKAGRRGVVRRRFARKYRGKKTGLGKEMKKAIGRLLDRRLELKSQVFGFSNNPMCLQTTGSSLSGNYAVISPSQSAYGYTMTRGTANNQMVGNRIKIRSLVHKFVITPEPYNATTNTQVTPTNVIVYYFKSKRFPAIDQTVDQFANSVSAGLADFLDIGGDYGFVGNLLDLTRKVAPENYTLLKRRVYKIGNASPPTGSSANADHPRTNNDYKMNKIGSVNLTKYAKGTWTQDDSGAWTRPWIFCIWQVVDATGNIFAVSQLPVFISNSFICKYTDA